MNTHLANRRGFSLLEVMVALAILTTSLVILVETQSSAVLLTREAERMITATDLAQTKLTEAKMRLEEEGFIQGDIYEEGDFDDFGDDAINLEFGKELEDYHWEYTIAEVNLELAGDLAGAAGEMDSSGLFGDGGGVGDILGGGGDAAAGGGASAAMGAVGMGPEAISQMLAPYIREIRVRVWWGKNIKEAEEDGTEVVLVAHEVNPGGQTQAPPGSELPIP